jgi:hypothetical protein
MKSFIVHLSDPSGVDDQAVVVVQDGMGLGQAVHVAIDELAERHGGQLAFPLFVDIHPVANYKEQAWMYKIQPQANASSGTAIKLSPSRP